MALNGLGTWPAKRRLKSPDRAAMIFGEEVVTYRDFANRVDRAAALLCRLGVRRGDSVAYFGENSPAFLVALFGCAQSGAVFVPVNTRLAHPESAYIVSDCRAVAVIHDEAGAERAMAAAAAAEFPIHVVSTAQLEPSEAIAIGMDDCPPPLALGTENQPKEFDPAAIIYTSGTTGRPKGAVLTHGNFTWGALNCIIDYDVVSTDVALLISPLFHAAALGMGALPVLLKGGTLVLEHGFEAGRALELIERHGVTMLSGVPTTYQLMADHPRWASTDLSSLAKLTCGGSPVPTRILHAYEARGLSFSQGYGMTETAPGATSLDARMTRAKEGSVGLAHFFSEIRVRTAEGEPAEPGEVGEIEISGPNVFAGYHGLPEEDAKAFTDGRWFRSGDLGRLDDDGYLYIADRLKDMIISGGENIYPAEVEQVLDSMKGVTGSAVIGAADIQWGEVPWAFVTVREGTTVDTDSVRAFLDGKLARYKIPKKVIVVEELPRTGSGKVRKSDLRAMLKPDHRERS